MNSPDRDDLGWMLDRAMTALTLLLAVAALLEDKIRQRLIARRRLVEERAELERRRADRLAAEQRAQDQEANAKKKGIGFHH